MQESAEIVEESFEILRDFLYIFVIIFTFIFHNFLKTLISIP